MIRLFSKESAEDALKRIRSAIQRDNNTRLIRCIIMDGDDGYKRDSNVYKANDNGRRSR